MRALPSSPSAPPVPVAATFELSTAQVTVRFDQALVPGITAQSNWFTRATVLGTPLALLMPAGATIAGSDVTWTASTTPTFAGADIVSYNAVPPDVVSLANGLPAPLFAAFPLSVV